jgi:hypothetical protein
LLTAAQACFAFEGDYVWDERFKEAQSKAALGDAKSQYTMGEMYLNGRGTPQAPAEALVWFLKAAKQGHVKAAYKAGQLYLRGEGAKRSLPEALNWLKRAAEAEYAPAQYELGRFYVSDDTDNPENSLALIWLGRAKKNGYRPAEEAFAELVRRMVKSQKVDIDPPQ